MPFALYDFTKAGSFISALIYLSNKSAVSGINVSAEKTRIIRIISWKQACPKMCLNIFLVTMYSWREWGGLFKRSSAIGGSVASAKEARVSMIRFIQSI